MPAVIGDSIPTTCFPCPDNGRGISGDARNSEIGKPVVDLRSEPAAMPRLDNSRNVNAPAQGLEKPAGNILVEPEARWQLHEQDAKSAAETCYLIHEAIEQCIATFQPRIVRNRFRHLHGKTKIDRRRLRPALIGLALVGPIERRIDLDRVEAVRVALQMSPAVRYLLGIALRYAPTGRSDPQKRFRHQSTAIEGSNPAASPASDNA